MDQRFPAVDFSDSLETERPEDMPKLFKKFDKDGNGDLEMEEFCATWCCTSGGLFKLVNLFQWDKNWVFTPPKKGNNNIKSANPGHIY